MLIRHPGMRNDVTAISSPYMRYVQKDVFTGTHGYVALIVVCDMLYIIVVSTL